MNVDINLNEKGLTLVEVLASISILSIIFLSVLYFIPQMGVMNNKNEEKTQAINTAKQILVTWQNSVEVQEFLDDPTSGILPGYVKIEGDYYYCTINEGAYTANIKVKKTSEFSSPLTSSPLEVHFIQVQLLNKKNLVVTEIYGYIKS